MHSSHNVKTFWKNPNRPVRRWKRTAVQLGVVKRSLFKLVSAVSYLESVTHVIKAAVTVVVPRFNIDNSIRLQPESVDCLAAKTKQNWFFESWRQTTIDTVDLIAWEEIERLITHTSKRFDVTVLTAWCLDRNVWNIIYTLIKPTKPTRLLS